ncbi:MAG: hypothetical protein ABRQ24_08785 [Syntrophomonadaceae bacterium]
MRITFNTKRLQICVLLCCLLLLEYANFGIFSSAQISSAGASHFNIASSGGLNRHASMGDSVYAGVDWLAGFKDFTKLTMASAGKTRGLGFNNNYPLSAILSAAVLAGLISYLWLARQIYNQFDSIQITTFLHKRDGMK